MADCGKTNTAAEEHSQIERGVSNPRVIDLIAPFQSESSQPESSKAESLKAESGVELVMIEDRPWGSDPAQLDQLQEKLNNYLDYVLDGFLAQQYPAYAGRKIRIALECVNAVSYTHLTLPTNREV